MSAVREGVLIVSALIRQELIKRKRKKRCWVKKWIARRNTFGASNTLCLELQLEDEETFKNMFRVTKAQFSYLLQEIGPSIQKRDTNMRQALAARTKLEITLKFLATGDSFQTLSEKFRVPRCTISYFLVEVLQAIYTTLEDFIKVPRTKEEWVNIQKGFASRWQFPTCTGALDGKHILIKCPPGTGSEFFNYKNTFSIVLLGCVDYDYCFIYVDIGAKGRNSDGGIFNESTLKKAIEENTLDLPSDAVFVGDEAFPLKPYLMKPYPRRNNLSKEQKIYNYRLCRCRRIVENAFGILVSRFRIFERPIGLAPEKIDVIVKTTCVLHNWLRKTSPNTYTPPGFLDEDTGSGIRLGMWREHYRSGAFDDLLSQNFGNFTREAISIREQYCDYFNNRGAVPWQDNAIFL